MKISTINRFIFLGLSAIPFTLSAQTPIPWGSYTTDAGTNNGTLTSYTGCSEAGVTCGSTPIEDSGFYQRAIEKDGVTYFHTIVLGGAGQGEGEMFASESFVAAGQTTGGIAAQQKVDDNRTQLQGGNGVLESTSTILRGNLFYNSGAGDKQTVLAQSLSNSTDGVLSSGEFQAGFSYEGDLAALGVDGLVNDIVANTTLTQTILPTDGSFKDSFTLSEEKEIQYVSEGVFEAGYDINGVSVGKSVDIDTKVHLGNSINDQVFKYDYLTGTKNSDVSGGASATTDHVEFADLTQIDWMALDTIEQTTISQSVQGAGDFGFIRFQDLAVVGAGDDMQSKEVLDISGGSSTLTYDLDDPFAAAPF